MISDNQTITNSCSKLLKELNLNTKKEYQNKKDAKKTQQCG